MDGYCLLLSMLSALLWGYMAHISSPDLHSGVLIPHGDSARNGHLRLGRYYRTVSVRSIDCGMVCMIGSHRFWSGGSKRWKVIDGLSLYQEL